MASRPSNNKKRDRGRGTNIREDARRRALDALNMMRTKRWSLAKSAREALTTRRTMLRYVQAALSKTDSRKYAATASDRLARSLRFLTDDRQITVTVRSSRKASQIAAYWTAVDHYLKTGETDQLRKFSGRSITVGKTKHPFITDPRILNRIASAGEVSFEDIYAHTT